MYFKIKHGHIPAIAMLVYQKVSGFHVRQICGKIFAGSPWPPFV